MVAFSLEELTKESGLSRTAAKRQLLRLSNWVIKISRKHQFYLVVSPEHRIMGTPPANWWLDDYFKWLGRTGVGCCPRTTRTIAMGLGANGACATPAKPSRLLRITYTLQPVSLPGPPLNIKIEANVTERTPHRAIQEIAFAFPFQGKSIETRLNGYDLHDSPVWQRETPKAGRPCHPGAVETEPVSVLTIDTFQPAGLIESSSVVPAPHFTLGRIDSSGGNGAEGRKKDEL